MLWSEACSLARVQVCIFALQTYPKDAAILQLACGALVQDPLDGYPELQQQAVSRNSFQIFFNLR